jgi:predicted Zn-dependent peptidase
LNELFERFRQAPEPGAYDPAPSHTARVLVTERDSNQSHLRMSYRPSIDPTDTAQRAALTIYSTLLGGSMGSRLFDEIREQRGLCYSVNSFPHVYADVPVLQLSSGLESGKCVEAFRRMGEIVTELRDDGPTAAEVERARAYAAGARAIAFENTNAIARTSANQAIVFRQDIDPDAAIAQLDAVTFDQVREVAAGISSDYSVACVGPHTVAEFELA